MSAKEFLNGAYLIELRITAKEDQIKDLRERAEKVTTMMSDMPRGGGRCEMADLAGKIADLKMEIMQDTEELLKKRREIRSAIKEVENLKYQTVLELRYLNGMDWDDIARSIRHEKRYTLKMHGWALQEIEKRH